MDKVLGARLSAILFATLMFVGQLMFAYGAYANNFTIMLLGRLVFG
jgi:hypothetical protein